MRETLSFIDSIVYYQTYFPRQEYLARDDETKRTPIDRLTEQALALFSNTVSPRLKSRIEKPYHAADYEVLGAGFHSTVYRRAGGDTVEKLHRSSVHMDTTRQQGLVETYQDRQAIVEYYLGSFALHQSFSIRQHPLLSDKEAVIADQSYVDFTRITTQSDVLTDTLREQLDTFIDRSEQMTHDTGYVVDVGGANNLVVASGNLLLLDTLPCDPKYATKQTVYCALQRLEELHTLSDQ